MNPCERERNGIRCFMSARIRPAAVYLNGKELGTTNGLFNVDPGMRSIRIELEGRKPVKKQVNIRASEVTRVELSLEPRTGVQVGSFVGHMTQGTVELLGVTDYPPSAQSRWWRPDGSPAHFGPFLHQPTNWSTPSLTPRSFLVRIENLPPGVSYPKFEVSPCTGRWFGSTRVLGRTR